VVSANRKVIKKGLHFCIADFSIRLNCSDHLWFSIKLVDYLVDYPELNLQNKSKRFLSLEKFLQIKTNPKVWFNLKG